MLETIIYKNNKVLSEIAHLMTVIKNIEIHITIKKDVIVISSNQDIIDTIRDEMLTNNIEEYKFDNIGI